jgi:hypothetical protein
MGCPAVPALRRWDSGTVGALVGHRRKHAAFALSHEVLGLVFPGDGS